MVADRAPTSLTAYSLRSPLPAKKEKKNAVPQNHSLVYLQLFPWLLPVPRRLALRTALIRSRVHWIFYYYYYYFSTAVLESQKPFLNRWSQLMPRQMWNAGSWAGSSSLNLISSTRLHFLHHWHPHTQWPPPLRVCCPALGPLEAAFCVITRCHFSEITPHGLRGEPWGRVTGNTVTVWGPEAAENWRRATFLAFLVFLTRWRAAAASFSCVDPLHVVQSRLWCALPCAPSTGFLSDLCLESEIQTQRN